MTNRISEAEIVGQKHGALTIQKAWRNSKKEIMVRCRCDCGRGYQGRYYRIKAGHIKSCGCLTVKSKGSETWRKFSISPQTKRQA